MDASVSVIMPCARGHSKYVLGALTSCLQASPAPHEVIIVDDMSDPPVPRGIGLPSHAIAPPHIRLYRAEYHMGRSAARNWAVQMSTSSWLFFLDADDLLEPTAMSDFLSVLGENPNLDLVYADYDYLDEKGTRHRVEKRKWQRMDRPKIPGTANPVNIGMFVRRDRFLKIGGFDEDMSFMEYWDFFIRYTTNPSIKVAKTKRPLFVARCLSLAGERAQEMAIKGSAKIHAMIRGGYYRKWNAI